MRRIVLFLFSFLLFTGSCFAQYLFPVNYYEKKGEIQYRRFDVSGERIFWPLGKKGLLIFDASDVENLKRLKLYKPYEIRSYKKEYGSANAIKVFDDKAYFAHGDLGFEVLNISNIHDPEILGSYYRHQTIYNFKIYKNHAILALDDMGVEVIELDNYEDMQMVSRKNYDGVHVNNIAPYKNYLYASCGYYGLKIIPYKAPLEDFKGNIYSENYVPDNEVHKVLIHDDHAILANDADGLTIMDLSLPKHPAPIENIETAGKAMDILIQGNYLYVACTNGVEVYNINNINNVYRVEQFSQSGRKFQKLAMENDFLYATYKSGWWFWEKYGMMIFAVE
jgi:hypothetical protein